MSDRVVSRRIIIKDEKKGLARPQPHAIHDAYCMLAFFMLLRNAIYVLIIIATLFGLNALWSTSKPVVFEATLVNATWEFKAILGTQCTENCIMHGHGVSPLWRWHMRNRYEWLINLDNEVYADGTGVTIDLPKFDASYKFFYEQWKFVLVFDDGFEVVVPREDYLLKTQCIGNKVKLAKSQWTDVIYLVK